GAPLAVAILVDEHPKAVVARRQAVEAVAALGRAQRAHDPILLVEQLQIELRHLGLNGPEEHAVGVDVGDGEAHRLPQSQRLPRDGL
nr:hypothetical protein [Tanacetum cinerariifolium]